MLTALIVGYKRILRNIRSGKILNKIGSGKKVYFESSLGRIAFKYIPGEIGRLSKYYVRHYGSDEYEIDPNSGSILSAVMEGKPISKTRYDNYYSNKDISLNLGILQTPQVNKAIGT